MPKDNILHVLVTGGGGYIGSTLIPLLLARGCRVRVLDNLTKGGRGLLASWSDPAFGFQFGDIRQMADRRKALEGIHAVVHLAAIVGDPACSREPALAKSVNIDGSYDLIADAQQSGVARFVFASTCSNYGRMSDSQLYLDEGSELRPVSLYAESKVAVECALLAEAKPAFCATPLRFATVYGCSPRMRFDLTVNQFTKEMLLDRRVIIFGEQFWRPYIHVRDVARAIITALLASANVVSGRVFNVGDTLENYQKGQIAEMVRQEVGLDAVIERVSRTEDPRDYRVSFERVKRELGFQVSLRVRDGIREIMSALQQGIISNPEDPAYCN